MGILPKDYDKATADQYMKLEEGENRIRLLDDVISGYLYWTYPDSDEVVPKGEFGGAGSTPHRVEDFGDLSVEQRNGMKAFIAMVVYNYSKEIVQILEVTQSSIMNPLDVLDNSTKWGDLKGYDVVISKTKTGSEKTAVEYSVIPEPKEKLSKEAKAAFEATNINLKALFTGDDPFKPEPKEEETIDLDDIPSVFDGELEE
jgi:hypothetical protein